MKQWMRTWVIVGLAIAGSFSMAVADDDVGCGFGTQLWEGEEGVAFKVLAATTNGSFGNQTFGISTGTLGCSPDGVITAQYRVNMYASANLDRLAREMAMGEGEALDSLAHLMGIADADKPAFFAMTQARFADIFSSTGTTAGDMVTRLNELMSEDERLAHYSA